MLGRSGSQRFGAGKRQNGARAGSSVLPVVGLTAYVGAGDVIAGFAHVRGNMETARIEERG
jgi:hypothetical protein